MEMELKERDIYIDCITRRMQSDCDKSPSKKSICSSSNTKPGQCAKPGKVQSIVRQMSKHKSNCKSGIDNCRCGSLSKTSSKISKTRFKCVPSADSVHDPLKQITNNLEFPSNDNLTLTAELLSDSERLKEELSSEEIRNLRCQNSVLHDELTQYKKEIKEMSLLIEKFEDERKSNTCLEQQLKCGHDEMINTMQTSICAKDDELCLLKEKAELLKTQLDQCREELQKLHCLEKRCKELNGELQCVQLGEAQKSNQVNQLQDECKTFCNENACLQKRIRELEIDLEEQRKYAKALADQLCNRQKYQSVNAASPSRPQTEDELQNREFLKKSIKELKNNYMTLQKEKLEMIRCYENKLNTLECENDSLRCRRPADKTCECDWSDFCGDVLLRKASKFGLCSLSTDELSDLHNRVRVSMIQAKKSTQVDVIPNDYYTRIADEIKMKYNLSDSLKPAMDLDDFPVKDFDMISSKTLPSILRCSSRQTSKRSSSKPRARSSENTIADKNPKCATVSRGNQKK